MQSHVNLFRLVSEIDRKDLAVQMRKRVGDYSRVVDLLRTGGGKTVTCTLTRDSKGTNGGEIRVAVE